MKDYSRREALTTISALTLFSAGNKRSHATESRGDSAPVIATNTYPWLTFARRANRAFKLHTSELLASIAATGINGYEPIIEQPDEFHGLGPRLKQHGLTMQSIYVNSVLHDATKVDASIAHALAIADAAVKLGVKMIVTNPSPIRWGGTEDKNDQQLRLQAKSLDRLGEELRQRTLTLAYHNHDAELRQGGREFHHMLTSTDPRNVKFCLDAHWIYRGCGNSQVALFDALSHYHERIVELHLRQSVDGVWTESFAMKGDIDYQRLLESLTDNGIVPHLVLEQAVESTSPKTLTVVDAHRLGNANLRKAPDMTVHASLTTRRLLSQKAECVEMHWENDQRPSPSLKSWYRLLILHSE